jgi:hypothetical protein
MFFSSPVRDHDEDIVVGVPDDSPMIGALQTSVKFSTNETATMP